MPCTTRTKIDGNWVRYYTAKLNPDIEKVLQRREKLGIGMFSGVVTTLDQNISLAENKKKSCQDITNHMDYPDYAAYQSDDNYPDYHLGIDPNIEAPPAYLREDVPIDFYRV